MQFKSHIYRYVVALGCGGLFGIGLLVSGMADPAKVIGFLNITGDWDPALLFVMGGAMAVYMPIYHLVIRRRIRAEQAPVFAEQYRLPLSSSLDLNLILGAAIFGIGWGMVGICPGPALVSLLSGHLSIVLFVLAMVVGIKVGCWIKLR